MQTTFKLEGLHKIIQRLKITQFFLVFLMVLFNHEVMANCVSGDCENGYGVYDWNNGVSYRGYWSNRLPHGKGEIMWSRGKENDGNYDGDWINGKRTGYGVKKYIDGSVYEGEWLNGMRHGDGKFIWPNGSEYNGEWNYGKKTGKEVLTPSNEGKTNETFEDGRLKSEKSKTSTIFMGMICFIILAGGVIWQIIVFEKDSDNDGKRLIIPLVLAILVVFGSITWSIFSLIDSQQSVIFIDEIKFIGMLVATAIIFWIKVAFGPILISTVVSWGFYKWFQYDIFELVPIFQIVIEIFIDLTPSWVKNLYIYGTLSCALLGSIYNLSDFDV